MHTGNKVAARALVGSVHKFALLARELPPSLPPSAAASLRGVPLLSFVHHNSLLHLADALLLLQTSHAVRARELVALHLPSLLLPCKMSYCHHVPALLFECSSGAAGFSKMCPTPAHAVFLPLPCIV
eukprot:1158116-Pelagomonas_calceolata.AAC.10